MDSIGELKMKNSNNDKYGELSYSGCSLKLDSAESAEIITAGLRSCKRLTTFNLDGNTIGVEASIEIGKVLERHPEFKKAIWKNMFTSRTKEEIPMALRHMFNGVIIANAKLVVLNLSDNAFGPVGVDGLTELFASECCFTLKELILNNNGLGIHGANTLVEMLLNCYRASGGKFALTTFISGRNRLENPGAIALSRVFTAMKSLRIIRLPQNGIYYVGIKALCEAFVENPDLVEINLNDNTLDVKGAEHISKILPKLKRLEILNVGDCLIKTKGAKLIAAGIKKRSDNLKTLILDGNEIKLSGLLEIVSSVSNKSEMEVVSLIGNEFGINGVRRVLTRLKDNNKEHILQICSDDEEEDSSFSDNDIEEISDDESNDEKYVNEDFEEKDDEINDDECNDDKDVNEDFKEISDEKYVNEDFEEKDDDECKYDKDVSEDFKEIGDEKYVNEDFEEKDDEINDDECNDEKDVNEDFEEKDDEINDDECNDDKDVNEDFKEISDEKYVNEDFEEKDDDECKYDKDVSEDFKEISDEKYVNEDFEEKDDECNDGKDVNEDFEEKDDKKYNDDFEEIDDKSSDYESCHEKDVNEKVNDEYGKERVDDSDAELKQTKYEEEYYINEHGIGCFLQRQHARKIVTFLDDPCSQTFSDIDLDRPDWFVKYISMYLEPRYYDEAVRMLIKISNLSMDDDAIIAKAALNISVILYDHIFNTVEKYDAIGFVNYILVHLRLIKAEDRTCLVTLNKKAAMLPLFEALQCSIIPAHAADVIQFVIINRDID